MNSDLMLLKNDASGQLSVAIDGLDESSGEKPKPEQKKSNILRQPLLDHHKMSKKLET